MCWEKATRLQVALILILVISIPFLIAMIIVYSLCLTSKDYHSDDLMSCHEYCNYYYGRRELDSDAESALRSFLGDEANIVCPDNTEFSFVASLSEKIYNDVPFEFHVKCTVAIISRTWVLASDECVPRRSRPDSHIVRTGSKYWHSGGVVHVVRRFARPKHLDPTKLVAISIENNYPRNCPFPTVEFWKTQSLVNILSISRREFVGCQFGFISYRQIPRKPLNKITEVIHFDLLLYNQMEEICMKYIAVYQFNNENLFCGIMNDKCKYNFSSFLYDHWNSVLGINLARICDKSENSIYIFEDIHRYVPWLNNFTTITFTKFNY